MAGFAFRKNTIFDWAGVRFRVCEIPPDADILIQACDTGEMKLVPMSMLLEEYTQGRLRACVGEQELRAAKASYGRPLDDLAKPLRDEAKRRLHYVRAIAVCKRHLAVRSCALAWRSPLRVGTDFTRRVAY